MERLFAKALRQTEKAETKEAKNAGNVSSGQKGDVYLIDGKRADAREIAADLGRRLKAGEITNEEYDEQFEKYVASSPEFRGEVEGELMGVMDSDDTVDGGMAQEKQYSVSKESEENTIGIEFPKPIAIPGSNNVLPQSFVNDTLESFHIKNMGDYEQVQTRVFDTLLREGFFDDVNSRSRTDTNYGSGMTIETNKSGIYESFCLENYGRTGRFKKIIKLATIRELPKAIRHGKLIEDNVSNNHSNKKTTRYAYFVYDTQVGGIGVTLKLTIRKSAQKNKFWVHSVQAIKSANGSPADAQNSIKTGSTTVDVNSSISQSPDSVNRQFSVSDNPAAEAARLQNEIFRSGVRETLVEGDAVDNPAETLAAVEAQGRELLDSYIESEPPAPVEHEYDEDDVNLPTTDYLSRRIVGYDSVRDALDALAKGRLSKEKGVELKVNTAPRITPMTISTTAHPKVIFSGVFTYITTLLGFILQLIILNLPFQFNALRSKATDSLIPTALMSRVNLFQHTRESLSIVGFDFIITSDRTTSPNGD